MALKSLEGSRSQSNSIQNKPKVVAKQKGGSVVASETADIKEDPDDLDDIKVEDLEFMPKGG